MSQTQPYATRSIYHGWLPQNREIYHKFVHTHVVATRPNDGIFDEPKNPHVKEFIDAIKNSPVMKPLSEAMFQQLQIYTKNPKWKEQKDHQVDSLEHLGAILDSIVASGPKFWKLRNSEGKIIGEPVGVPIYVALDLLSNTSAAYILFQWSDFNVEARKLLNGWGSYLKTDDSAKVFESVEDGWFSKKGLEMLEQGLKGATFDETFQTELPAPRRYKTWDSFFIRSFKDPKLRPVEVLKRGGKDVPVINNACESTSLRIFNNVELKDQFWLKGQNYSLYDMLGGDPQINSKSLSRYAPSFVGGSVYQAFLSPQDYHRWHSPVNGKILDTAQIEGTYYAVLPDEGSPGDDGLEKGDPHGAIVRSQAWLSVSAARCIFIIKPDNEEIEMVALIGIGMGEVSSVVPTPQKNPDGHVNVGEELGMFHFGGSTHVVIIKLKNPNKKQLVFKDINDIPITPGQHRWINSIIARIEDIPEDE